MGFGPVLHNREAQTQPAVAPRRPRVWLTKALEDERRELGFDPFQTAAKNLGSSFANAGSFFAALEKLISFSPIKVSTHNSPSGALSVAFSRQTLAYQGFGGRRNDGSASGAK
jgi:hypothetical protein